MGVLVAANMSVLCRGRVCGPGCRRFDVTDRWMQYTSTFSLACNSPNHDELSCPISKGDLYSAFGHWNIPEPSYYCSVSTTIHGSVPCWVRYESHMVVPPLTSKYQRCPDGWLYWTWALHDKWCLGTLLTASTYLSKYLGTHLCIDYRVGVSRFSGQWIGKSYLHHTDHLGSLLRHSLMLLRKSSIRSTTFKDKQTRLDSVIYDEERIPLVDLPRQKLSYNHNKHTGGSFLSCHTVQ